MRILSTQEIVRIDERLESLKIQYLEIFHELRDHYFTELEKKPVDEFEPTFQQLNESFSWSIVKNMEKELRKATNRQIGQLQLDSLKFWNLGWKENLTYASWLGLMVLAFSNFGVTGLLFTTSILAFMVIIGIWNKLGFKDALNLSITNYKPLNSLKVGVFSRMGVAFGMLPWIHFGTKLSSDDAIFDSSQFIFGFIIVLSSLYLFSLVKVAFHQKLKPA